MRIALVSQEFPPETAHGGIATQTFLKARGLSRLGHDVHVVTRSADGRRHESGAIGVHVHRLVGGERLMPELTPPAEWLTWSVAVAAALDELMRGPGLDLVDVPEWGGEGYIHVLNRRAWDRVPVFVQLHGPLAMLSRTIGWPDPASELYRVGTLMEEGVLRLADQIYSSSACSRSWVAATYGLSAAAIPILHAGVDTDLFKPSGVQAPSGRTIVYAGRISRSKGVDRLVGAVLRIAAKHQGLRLRLIGAGDPELQEDLQRRTTQAGFPKLLDVRGHASRQDLPLQLVSGDVFAAPSLYEGGPGFAYLEAMACGLPAIGPTGSGIEETIVNGETGYLVDPSDEAALSDAIDALLSDASLRTAMGRQAREHVVATAETSVCVGRIADMYQHALAGEAIRA
jgi:glycosyltransferase involved in cell wall biosynthesis